MYTIFGLGSDADIGHLQTKSDTIRITFTKITKLLKKSALKNVKQINYYHFQIVFLQHCMERRLYTYLELREYIYIYIHDDSEIQTAFAWELCPFTQFSSRR